MDDGRRTGREYGTRVPKYLAIYRVLADRIADGRYPADAPLPAQRELGEEFDVSLMTVRQAIQALEADGLLETRHGVGTFVRRPSFAYGLTGLRSLSQDLVEQGIELETEVLDARLVVPPGDVGARLGVERGRVLAVERLRSTRPSPGVSVPLLLQTSYLPAGLIDVETLRHQSLYRLLEESGRPVRQASETIQAVALTAEQARVLRRQPGSPALSSSRLSRGEDGTPLVDDRALLVGDTVITAERAVTGTNLAYEHR